MPNNRIFEAQGLSSNGVAIGGMSAIGVNATFIDVIQSTPDGAIGPEDVDVAGLEVAAKLSTTDVSKVIALLDATAGSTTFSGRESGTLNWHHTTLGAIVWHAMRMNMSLNADATLECDGLVRFADGTKTLDDVVSVAVPDAIAPALTYPARLYRPNTASFDPDAVVGVGDKIDPLHVRSLSLSLSANVLKDYSDTDVGHTAVDRGTWKTLSVTLTHRDAKVIAPSDITAELLQAGTGKLTVGLVGRGGAAGKTLTVNNVRWTGATEQHSGEGYTDYTLTGVAGWRNGSKIYTLNTAPDELFTLA